MTYYNTTHLDGADLKGERLAAAGQEIEILAIFKGLGGSAKTPFEIHEMTKNPHLSPVTSTRRAMTNLTDKGYLVKTGFQRRGIYGKLNYCWRLA